MIPRSLEVFFSEPLFSTSVNGVELYPVDFQSLNPGNLITDAVVDAMSGDAVLAENSEIVVLPSLFAQTLLLKGSL